MVPVTCPEKAAFGTVWKADNFPDVVKYAGTERTGILDHPPIQGCPESHDELREKKPVTGSDWLSLRINRHGFPENRHGYFTNPSICPRIGGIVPRACPEKAAFSTVWKADNFRDGLLSVGMRETGITGLIPHHRSGVRRKDEPMPGVEA
jgi:hypothetical protein